MSFDTELPSKKLKILREQVVIESQSCLHWCLFALSFSSRQIMFSNKKSTCEHFYEGFCSFSSIFLIRWLLLIYFTCWCPSCIWIYCLVLWVFTTIESSVPLNIKCNFDLRRHNKSWKDSAKLQNVQTKKLTEQPLGCKSGGIFWIIVMLNQLP